MIWNSGVLRRSLVALTSLLFVLGLAIQAHAFCRQNACRDNPETGRLCGRDEVGCINEGVTLYYSTPCLSFGVARGAGAVLEFSDQEFEAIVSEAFRAWKSVDCGGGQPPGFEVQSVGTIDVDGNFFCESEVGANLSVWTSVSQWTYKRDALGYTSSMYAIETGEVFDADVELNLEKVRAEFPKERWRQVLLSVMTHEAGHFLGIGHSTDSRAVMAGAYSDFDLLNRRLTDDDVQAICTIYPPAALQCGEPSYSQAALDEQACEELARARGEDAAGCSVHAVRSGSSSTWMWGIAALGLCWVRRRYGT